MDRYNNTHHLVLYLSISCAVALSFLESDVNILVTLSDHPCCNISTLSFLGNVSVMLELYFGSCRLMKSHAEGAKDMFIYNHKFNTETC